MYDELSRDLKTLCNANGAAGLDEIAQVVMDMLRPLCARVWQDPMGNVLAVRSNEAALPDVMLEAHLDEIGMLVTDIDDHGFIHVSAAGGIDRRVLVSQKVLVHGDTMYSGVFCSIPPHLSKETDKLPELEDMGIDVGLCAAEAKARIPLGSRVTFAPNYSRLGDTTVSSKALDDRAGVMAIIHCLRQLDARANVSVAFCVQEELGCRGATVAARSLAPSMAIVTDVSFAMAPDEKAKECGTLGAGVMIGYSPILDPTMSEQSATLSIKEGILSQTEVMGGSTGTDADVISKSNGGIRTALYSIPLRYMHTPCEVADLRDIATVGELMAKYVEEVCEIG